MTDQNEQNGQGPIDFKEAKARAAAKLAEIDPDDRMQFIPGSTQEKVFGWVFFYTTKAYLASGNRGDEIPGNGPMVVYRHNGKIDLVSTSVPPQVAIKNLEDQWLLDQAQPSKP